MDLPWTPAGLSPSAAHELNLLSPGENLLLEIDDKTFQALMAPDPATTSRPGHDGEPGPSARSASADAGKRLREEDGVFQDWLANDFGPASGDAKDDEDDPRHPKKGKATAAAAVKASREKARRERLNDCFEELAKLCDPGGRVSRSDRVSVLSDAVRCVQHLRAENNQLRQLNKFLEERVAGYERARAQQMYQAAMQHQAAALQAQQAAALQQQRQQAAGAGAEEPAASAAAAPGLGGGEPAAVPAAAAPGMPVALVPLPVGALGMHLLGYKSDAAAGGGPPLAIAGAMPGPAMPLPAGAPAGSWLPAPDVSLDQKLRPPAA